MVMGELSQETQVVVIGGGPGGYAAAFRAADLGLDVTLVEMEPRCGGTCLLRGCIPSKALLQTAEIIWDAEEAVRRGVHFDRPRMDLDKLRDWKNAIVAKLAVGLDHLAKKRGVQILNGRATFEDAHTLRLEGSEVSHLKFRHAIIAVGSEPMGLPGVSPTLKGRIMDSTGALNLEEIPQRLLVVGGGYIGLELGCAYAVFGSRVTLVHRSKRILGGVDEDLVRPLIKRIGALFEAVRLETDVAELREEADGVTAVLRDPEGTTRERFDRVLIAIGRIPRSRSMGLEKAGITVDDAGFIPVDSQCRTSVAHIYAVGDVAGQPMLAHKAMREGKVAAEAIAGMPSAYDVQAIPAVVYTDPQIAWAGLTENEARRQNIAVKIARFPWGASGRALTMDAADGLTKILFDPDSGRLLGMGIVGRGAETMIAEGVLAIEMGASAEDVALTVHAHPTLSETEGEAAEIFLGSATHLYVPRGAQGKGAPPL
ncbi:dihydrolipoyl dehydrogenase [Desulfosoma caldarium]|uniref:Dihydrolipoyl dehydrogenase n=1 Tax=Desulfosoma caldarium TaxID=610254 RepID=A0A3N1VMZ3_9BACT|nr:dihydrolipoyl dehydrogenase [Desulfosoma caldarium]ROR03320.1 dihydrolipoamide dehydrogenase [Desulfosoma caldarium]